MRIDKSLDTDKQVFVDSLDSEVNQCDYDVISLKEALHDKREIIHCNYCKEPACILDSSYPYFTTYNQCGKHDMDYIRGTLNEERIINSD